MNIEILEELHIRYLPDPSLRPETWAEAVAWATKVEYGVSGLLVPGEYEATWRAFDYLPDSISRNKKDHGEIPDFIWEESLQLCPDDDDLWRIGMSAYIAGKNHFAIAAWEPLAESGNGSAASNLAAIFSEIGDHESARYWRYVEAQDDFHSVTIPIDSSKPLYDTNSGEVTFGESRDGKRLRVAIHQPGIGVRHGIIAGGKGVGKSNSMNLILLAALTSGKYVLWLMDWSPEQKHYKPLKEAEVTDWFAGNSVNHSLKMLSSAVRVLEFRKEKGGYIDPTPEKPAIVIGIEEAQYLFRQSGEASALCLQILREGAAAGVSLFLTIPDITLESFGGNAELRAEATANDEHLKFFMGSAGLPMLRDARRVRNNPMSDDPFT
ncbi:hypothetical protein ACWDBP_34685 [Streptomyces sp. NPDC001233]